MKYREDTERIYCEETVRNEQKYSNKTGIEGENLMSKKSSKINFQVWEKQPFDTNKSWAAFVIYRDFSHSERTLAKVAELLGKSDTLIERWSTKYDWVARVREYDVWIDRQTSQKKRLDDERKRLEMLERHTNVAVGVQSAVVQSFEEMTAADWLPIPVLQRTETFLKMAHFERLSRGLPGDSIEVRTPEQLKTQMVTEARLYLREVMHDFPILSEREHLQIVCEEFDLSIDEIGVEDFGFDLNQEE